MEETERRIALINQLIGLGVTAWMIWTIIPKHQRQLWLMKMAQRAQSQSQKLAQQTGRLAMRRELAGDSDTAGTAYETAYRLMNDVHHRAGAWYEKLRSST